MVILDKDVVVRQNFVSWRRCTMLIGSLTQFVCDSWACWPCWQ